MTKMNEQEIIETLQRRLIKGDYVKALCHDLGINDYALFGYIKQLKDLNINVSLSNKTDDIFLMINNSPDYTKENFYSIKESIDETTKIGVISDLRFGSRCEQIALLNDMYKKLLPMVLNTLLWLVIYLKVNMVQLMSKNMVNH